MHYSLLVAGGVTLIGCFSVALFYLSRWEDRNIMNAYEKRKEFIKTLIKEVLQETKSSRSKKS